MRQTGICISSPSSDSIHFLFIPLARCITTTTATAADHARHIINKNVKHVKRSEWIASFVVLRFIYADWYEGMEKGTIMNWITVLGGIRMTLSGSFF